MSKKKRRRRKKKAVGNTIDVRRLITKRRAPHRPTQTHDDGSAYNRAREKARARKEG